ncbi:hypothetical protein AAEX28_14020 [Lentisphaerota bacterium WC36G]|nr:hypothetical protein LJT99_00770 [Lentisphaerae bacterium WC36]
MWTTDINTMVIWIVLGFLGGMFGATIGGLLAFVFCGIGALISSALMLAGLTDTANFVDAWITWGPFIGPQTSFVGGCWAAAYAKHRAGFQNGRDICQPLVTLQRPDVLLIGGIGGVVGAICTWLAWLIPNLPVVGSESTVATTNSVALGVMVASIIGRLVVGKSGIFGKVPDNVNRFDGDENNCWIPWQHSSLSIIILATMVGATSAILTYLNSNMHLMLFGVMTVLFAFMILGQGVIAGHHYAITAYFAVAATGNVAWGIAFALIAGFACDFFAFLFTAHGDSHIDPPTCAIAFCGTLQPLLICFGLMPYTPMNGANTVENLFNIKNMLFANNSTSGVIALLMILVLLPLITKLLRNNKTFLVGNSLFATATVTVDNDET